MKKKCINCISPKIIDAWTEKFEDKHGVTSPPILGKLLMLKKQECQDCGNIILTVETKEIDS